MEKYKIVNGTSYNRETNDEVIKVLEKCRQYGTRIVLDYGCTETGETWNEVYDVTGKIGRSTGDVKIPILIHNKRSVGGCGILDSCIIGIKESLGKKQLYSLNKHVMN